MRTEVRLPIADVEALKAWCGARDVTVSHAVQLAIRRLPLPHHPPAPEAPTVRMELRLSSAERAQLQAEQDRLFCSLSLVVTGLVESLWRDEAGALHEYRATRH